MTDLTFAYRRTSTLPRREFVVNTRRCEPGCCGTGPEVLVSVTAPDAVVAVDLVVKHLRSTLLPGWHWHREPRMVREVERGWDGYGYRAPVVRVCEAY